MDFNLKMGFVNPVLPIVCNAMEINAANVSRDILSIPSMFVC